MAPLLKIPIGQMSESLLKEIVRDFGRAPYVEVSVPDALLGGNRSMETFFWQIIDLIDWKQGDYLSMTAPATQALSEKPEYQIYLFEEILAEKLYLLDTRKHAEAIARKDPDRPFSADGFLYDRCGVVAEGREYFERVLAHPEEMPDDISFEPLLNFAADAYRLKTGRDFDCTPSFNYETQSNHPAWA